ncbi:Aspartate carbamoyltransferase catalytic subunit [Candidatus Kinetoplastibacterium sorsogonicusi]|uniref:Aspartate carbamoyltransferase n=1 Tax=Candidatus Kinetoplastidibacterium kentomonadis TaxID=1576550 RepID=A0A3S7J9I4_9PROT|nr:Aspartate carbamoyltransferase catalytic subunit [Candidatus Kinetoplastibacterium sorsogonicusi]
MKNTISYNNTNHLLSIDQFDRDSVEKLFRIADMMKPITTRQKICRVLEGAVLGNLFFEASTRTRVSFGAAFCRLGGSVCDTTGFTFSSMAKGESISDTSKVISGYVDIMVIRHPEIGSVAQFANATNIPVVNGGDGPGEHPSQALLDLYTILTEFDKLNKTIDGSHIAIVGDLKYGRTVHSLIKLLSLYKGLKISLISPNILKMPKYLIDQASTKGNVIEEKNSITSGLENVDVIYATRLQKERFTSEIDIDSESSFQINLAKLNLYCKKDTIVMHPLPRDSRPGSYDLSTDLDKDPRLAIFRQADNGINIRMAIFSSLLEVDDLIERSMKDAKWKSPKILRPI